MILKNQKKKKIRINPLKLAFILVIVVAAFIIFLLEQFVPAFDEAFEHLNDVLTAFLLKNTWISFGIWIGVLIGKGLGIKDFLELKRASQISFVSAPFGKNPQYAALIAFIAHCLSAVMDTIATIFEFKFIGVEAQSVNTTLVEWVIIVFWNVIYYVFIFPIKYCGDRFCKKQLCLNVEPLQRQRSTITSRNDNPTNNDSNTDNIDNNDINTNNNECCQSFINYMKYDNSAFKLVGKTNLEYELNIVQFLKLSPYCIMNHNIGVYVFAIIMLVFNSLSAFADAVFFLFNWHFGKKSLLIIAGQNFFDGESYLKTYIFTLTFLDADKGLKTAVLINSAINIVGKIIGILFTYLINVLVCKPIVSANPKMYDKSKGIGFKMGTISGETLSEKELNQTTELQETTNKENEENT